MKFLKQYFFIFWIILSGTGYAQVASRDTNIVIINVEKINREMLAEVLDSVIAAEPKVIGLDVFFWEDSANVDTALERVLSKPKNIVFGSRLYGHVQDNFFMENRKSHAKFSNGELYGFTNLVAYDSVVKEVQPRAFANFEMHYSFGVQTAMVYDSILAQRFIDRFNKDEKIHYLGNSEAFYLYNYRDIHEGTLPKEVIKDKIVLLGYAKGKDEDIFKTPLTDGKQSEPDMHGVVIHANIISMILEQRYE